MLVALDHDGRAVAAVDAVTVGPMAAADVLAVCGWNCNSMDTAAAELAVNRCYIGACFVNCFVNNHVVDALSML